MSWQAGDLALAIGAFDPTAPRERGPKIGSVNLVTRVTVAARWTAITLAGHSSRHFTEGWDSRCFRKIEPDQHKASEPRREPVPQQKAPLSASGGE